MTCKSFRSTLLFSDFTSSIAYQAFGGFGVEAGASVHISISVGG